MGTISHGEKKKGPRGGRALELNAKRKRTSGAGEGNGFSRRKERKGNIFLFNSIAEEQKRGGGRESKETQEYDKTTLRRKGI